MLCSICKKNAAVIFVNKIDKKAPAEEKGEPLALCTECAQKQGIDPAAAMMSQLNKFSPDEMQNMSKQFEEMLGSMGMNVDSMMDPSDLFNSDNNFADFDDEDDDEDEEDISPESMMGKITKTKTKKDKKKKKLKHLEQFGLNLTEQARKNELDKVIGRENELSRVIQILNRRKKNNPALIGEPGVGKTAITAALAQAIVAKKVPQKLLDKEVYQIDMASIFAGTQFRGQFEARMKGLIDECRSAGNIILVLDELHTLVGGSDHDNTLNAANILKPALANGDIQMIGTTTLKEYRKHIEKDSALERRFQQVIIDAPSKEDSVKIICGIKKYYEDYHSVQISNSIVEEAVVLADKYVHDRFLPDKAIDLLDEACSKVNLANVTLSEIQKLENKLNQITNEREIAVEDASVEAYEKAAVLKSEECAMEEKLNKLKKKLKKPSLDSDDLAGVIELWTKIPISRIKAKESEKILNIESSLSSKIVGQEQALKSVSQCIIRKRANLKNVCRPPSFIFVGPTGVGKTELVKRLSYELFDRKDAIIKLDMSEYMESHSVSKLIGSPPGYVGYDEAGQLTEKIRRNPYSIVLFDEIEKAHPSITNMLLQILDEGVLTDAQGKSVSFKHCIIILTSNLGTNFKNEGYGFGNAENDHALLETKVVSSLKEFFAPEFLNRLDEIIVFNKLSHDSMLQIVNLMLDEFSAEVKSKNITVYFTNAVKEFIIEKGFDPKFGARPLRRAIERNIEDVLAVKFIKGELKSNHCYTVDYLDNTVVVN
ncbi:MAG: ATP-dependent Clp protease ATP-binding subunit [Clostridia bacterium]